MKKLLYCAAALATMFFTACQQENLEPAEKGSTVSFSVEVPGLAVTKADVVDNGSNINDLVYAVYKVSDEATTLEEAVDAWSESMLVYQVNQTTTDFTGGRTKVDVELLNDQNYVVLFWAQVDDAWVSGDDFDLTEITYPDDMTSSNSNLAAFSGHAFIAAADVEKNVSRDVTLYRPFAQINVGTTLPRAFTVEFEDSKVTVYKAGNSFNVASQTAKGTTDVVFGEAALPSNYLNVENDATNYTYVAMNYVFANGVVDVEYDIETLDHGTVNRTIPAVPVEKNYRTNIIGNLLTSNAEYKIVLDAQFNEPAKVVEVVSVSTAAQLVEALTAPAGTTPAEGEETNIKLEGDINLNDLFASLTRSAAVDHITIAKDMTITLDLNGYSLTGVDETTANFGLIQNNGNLTLINSASQQSRLALVATNNNGWNRYSAVISNNPGATLTVKGNVLVEHRGGTDMAYGIDILTNGNIGDVQATIDGATVKSTYRAIRQFLNSDSKENELLIKAGSTVLGAEDNKAVFFHDASTKSNNGTLTIEEGAVVSGVYLYVTPNSADWPVQVSIADSSIKDGYAVVSANVPGHLDVVNNNGVWTIETVWFENGDEVLLTSASALKNFASLVNAGDTFEGKTVKLGADIDLKNENWTPIGYWQTFNGTFDGQGYTISNLKHNGTEEDCYVGLFGYTENATIKNLTINNVDLKLVANASWAGGHMGALVGNAEGTIVIENINVTGDVKIDGDLTKAGAGRIGGVVGGNACTGLIKNVVVNANAGSFVKGNNSVGGIAGQLQPTHIGGALSFENCSSNIDVTAAQFYAGGIIGLSSNAISFTDCSASGNISVVAGRSGNDNDLYRVGGIAGGWDDGADKVLSLVDCSTTCVLAGQSADGRTATGFDCGGYVGRGYSTVVGAKVNVNGAEYVYAGNGVYTLGEYAVVNNGDALVAALAQKQDVKLACNVKIDPANMSNAYGRTGILVYDGQTIDGSGYTIDVKGAGGTWDSGICTSGGLIKDVWVTGSFRGIFVKGATHTEKVVLENVRVEGTTYTISIDQASGQGLEATNSIFRGWTSYAGTIGEVKFNGCTFGAGNGYNFSRPYAVTEYVNCTFEAGHQMDPRAAVTFENCTIGGVALTAENLSTLVISNIANASVK